MKSHLFRISAPAVCSPGANKQFIFRLAALTFALASYAIAADKPGRLSGSVVNLSKDKSEIAIQQGTATRIVEFSTATDFTAGSPSNPKTAEKASAEDVKLGNYLTCVGTWDGVKLAATKCTVRPSKKP